MEAVPVQGPELLLTIYANNVQKKERQTDRKKDRQKERQAGRQTDRPFLESIRDPHEDEFPEDLSG